MTWDVQQTVAMAPSIDGCVSGGGPSSTAVESCVLAAAGTSYPARPGISTTTTPTAANGLDRHTATAIAQRQGGSHPRSLVAEPLSGTLACGDTPGGPSPKRAHAGPQRVAHNHMRAPFPTMSALGHPC